MEGCQKPDPIRFGEIGAKSENVGGGLEVAERNYGAPSYVKATVGKATFPSAGVNQKSTKVGACQLKASETTSPPLATMLGVLGRWGACGPSVVQLDHDEETGAVHRMYGTLGAELEVQRTIKRAE